VTTRRQATAPAKKAAARKTTGTATARTGAAKAAATEPATSAPPSKKKTSAKKVAAKEATARKVAAKKTASAPAAAKRAAPARKAAAKTSRPRKAAAGTSTATTPAETPPSPQTSDATPTAGSSSLARYWAKRDFSKTPEPREGRGDTAPGELAFVIQKHAATRLHYDFRLEWQGVMLSWAVPKGPSYDPKVKRMAVQTEDHPISYNRFEGTIPKGQYGAGTVIVWDRGTWEPLADPARGLVDGKLVFRLHGEKMHGAWELIRIRKPGEERQDPWLLFKKHDEHERPSAEYDVVTALPDSVLRGPPSGAKDVAGPTQRGASASASASASRPGSDSGTEAEPAHRPRRGARADATTGDSAGDGPTGARPAPLPATLAPQLATLVTAAPARGDWIYEIKFDGYRVMTRIEHGVPHCITRGGHDWSDRMPHLVRDLAALGLDSAWLDGEIVVLGEHGLPDFNALQNAFDGRRTGRIQYFLFDLPYLDGHDLRAVPLRERRALLKALLDAKGGGALRYSEDFPGDAASVLGSADRLGLEGVMAKRADAPYASGRSEAWLKLKCRRRQEFVIGGYTDRGLDENAAEIGSLLLGVYDDDGHLVPAGNVGTGWDGKTAAALKQALLPLARATTPFHGPSKRGRWSTRAAGSERWVAPERVAEVSFADWTPDGHVRHAVFVALREEKPAREIRRERAAAPPGGAAAAPAGALAAEPARAAARTGSRTGTGTGARTGAGVKVTHPERVIDASTGTTKLDLVRYYESVADFMLPHLVGRPCSLVRGPSGIGGELFFQKHAEKLRIPELRDLDAALWPGHEPLLEVPTARALAGAAQMNVIEFHTWNAKVKAIDRPDRVIFDIDPGEGVAWKQVQEAAEVLHRFLDELGLEAWLKTSGGKGLHVVVPLTPRDDWDTVKGLSQAVVQHLARVLPQRFVAKSGGSNRVGRIFVDYLRNGHGATTAAAYSARARPGLGVSMPVPWDALGGLKSGAHWTIATAREHLSFQTDDPWAGYWKKRQTLRRAIDRLGLAGS
jgi:bifunctional non-homologous end joining protein LigD